MTDRGMLAVAAWLAGVSLAVAAVPVHAQENEGPRVLLWPVKGDGVTEDTAYQLGAALRRELETMLNTRVVSQDETEALRGAPAVKEAESCLDQLSCATALGKEGKAGMLLLGVVRPEGTDTALELRVVDVTAHRESGRVSGVIPSGVSERGAALREMAARLVAPEKFVGTVVFNGLTADVKVVLDNEPRPELVAPAADVGLRIPMRVGKHSVDLKRGNKVVLSELLDVRFEEIVVVMVPAPGTVAPSTKDLHASTTTAAGPQHEKQFRLPIWVGPVVYPLAIPPLLVGAVFLLDMLYIGPAVLTRPSQCQPVVAATSSGGGTINTQATPLNMCGALWRVGARKEEAARPALAGDLAAVAISVTLAAMVGVFATGLLIGALLPQPAE